MAIRGRWWLTLLLLGAWVTCVAAQSEIINGDRVLVGTLNYCADAGSTDAYACNLDPAITAYVTGAHYLFKANTANTGTASLNLNAIGAKTIVKVVGGITTTLSDNDIRAGQFVDVVYDGTNLQMQSVLANFPASLAANGSNCAAGNLAAGVDASGGAEGCVTLSAINPQTTTYQVLAADFDGYKTISVASGTFTITLVASGSQPANGKYIKVLNYGSGVVTIARSGQNINGGTTSLTLPAGSATAPMFAKIESDGTNYFAYLGIPPAVTTLASLTSVNGSTIPAAAGGNTLTQTIASGALALSTSAIASAACTTAQTATATGTATTDVVLLSFNADPTAVTGYVPLTAGMLTIIGYPTTNTVNIKVCNNTSSSITPGAVTLNWRVVR